MTAASIQPSASDLHLCSPAGFSAAGVSAGLKRSGKPDLGLLVCTTARPASAAATFTDNQVVAAPVIVGREHLATAGGYVRAVVVNSGNANACTGPQGVKDARATCKKVANFYGCDASLIFPSSTGIIGQTLPMEKLLAGLDTAHHELGDTAEHSAAFEKAILTTDLVPKHAATTVTINRQKVTIAGVTKGSGMIGPMMSVAGTKVPKHATMLAYLTTDAGATPAALRKLMSPAVTRTFNRITVDGHASTNDTALLLASGASGAKVNTIKAAQAFLDALTDVCDSLAYQIAADGEGATKVVVITVAGARSDIEATRIARVIADSPLVKCAMHGNDPNWGRIISAAGYADAVFDPDKCELRLLGEPIFRRGRPLPFDAADLSKKLDAKRVDVRLDCKLGDGTATVYTCDLSREYITINADYHT